LIKKDLLLPELPEGGDLREKKTVLSLSNNTEGRDSSERG